MNENYGFQSPKRVSTSMKKQPSTKEEYLTFTMNKFQSLADDTDDKAKIKGSNEVNMGNKKDNEDNNADKPDIIKILEDEKSSDSGSLLGGLSFLSGSRNNLQPSLTSTLPNLSLRRSNSNDKGSASAPNSPKQNLIDNINAESQPSLAKSTV